MYLNIIILVVSTILKQEKKYNLQIIITIILNSSKCVFDLRDRL